MNTLLANGILGTNADTAADLTLLAYILLILPAMVAGFVFARRKMYEPHHKYVMTGITIANWLLVLFVMVVSYAEHVAEDVPGELGNLTYLLPTVHLLTGGAAQLLATYLVIRMWFEDGLPAWFKVKNIKRPMRATLALWVVTALLGFSIYARWYVEDFSDSGDNGAGPAATEEPFDLLPGVDEDGPVSTPDVDDGPIATEKPAG
jgi:uncharacterized membrane protein YozB (DUF420 family)